MYDQLTTLCYSPKLTMENPSNTLPLTAFDRALEAYLSSLPKDKKKFKFVDVCRGSGEVTPQEINDFIQNEVSKRTLSGPAKRLFNRLINAVKDFSGVIDQIASVQPLPLCIIWGGLKAVIEGAARCKEMFDLMKDELRSLADLIENIADYEDLYGDSEVMQDLFFRSYTNIVSFWHRVHKECRTTEMGSFRRSMTSSSLNKLKAIVGNLKQDVYSISQKASVLQADLDAKEYCEARQERAKADTERIKQSDWRQKQSAVNYLELSTQIRNFLTPRAHFANANYHEKNLQQHLNDTCRWLADDTRYIDWTKPSPALAGNSVFCLSGPAGFGKSILSSFAIRHLQEEHGAAVAYFFCQFSEPCENARDILLLLALQLFDIYFARKLPVDEALCHKVLCCTSTSQIQELISELSVNLSPVYFVVDGLDEAQKGTSQQTISTVLKFICDEMLGNSKLWITIRKQARPVDCYETVIRRLPHTSFEMIDETEADVVRYLDAKFGALEKRFGTMSEDDRVIFHFSKNYLKSRAKGHFLWARLMTEDFEGIEDVQDLFKRINGPPPERLDDLYRDIFGRIKPENRKIASKLIGLVAFSRRQLRVEEVREAIILLVTRGKKNASDSGLASMSTTTLLSKFTALVEVDKGLPESEGSCRLVHSSALEFLLNHPNVLGDERALQITPYTIADACLSYLTRPIYGSPLRSLSVDCDAFEWVDSAGHSMDEHHFVQYAAKYWSRHLEDIEPEKSIRGRVAKFVESKNFQTCMQIQTIWIQGKFDIYAVGGKMSILRNLPEWFISSSSASAGTRPVLSKHWADYRILLHNWRHLLSCGSCHDSEPDCPILHFRGDIDRVWWASLGADHIFSQYSSRYVSFSLVEGAEKARFERGDRFEALCVTLDQSIVLRLRAWNHQAGTLEFVCERWTAGGSGRAPTLRKKHSIHTTYALTNWRLYTKYSADEFRKLVAKPVAFSATGEYLRVGSQLFASNGDLEYRAVASFADDSSSPYYFEELNSRDTFIVIGSRTISAAKEVQNHFQFEDHLGEDLLRFEQLATRDEEEEDSVGEYSDDEYLDEEMESSASSDDSSSVFDEAEGYESWSEGSTDNEEDILQDSDSEDEKSLSECSMDDESGDSDSDVESETPATEKTDPEQPEANQEIVDDDSDDEDDIPPPTIVNLDSLDSDDEGEVWGHVIDSRFGHGRSPFRQREEKSKPSSNDMLLTVFDNSGNHPRKIFQFAHPLSLMLYESPPAIHPHAPLVVWPLGAGDMLFADFELKTYFVRKVKASAPYSRNISTKLHFHPSGDFLHVAFIEAQLGGQVKSSSRKRKQATQNLPSLKLSALLSTYRLSSTKTTRSPPSLIHRVKIDLGEHFALIPTRLPFTFTWTDENLFISRRSRELNVFRISLFAKPTRDQNILVPRNTVLLPDTAMSCDVHFVPSVGSTPARIILSSESSGPRIPSIDANADPVSQLVNIALESMENDSAASRKILSSPIGCLLHEEDIGEWVKVDEIPVPTRQGAGKLDRRKERFDPVDDCDVEPYLRFV
ncbi:hypothetical protein SCHPADRAFT_528732 [Schizopora paradoxa]|uniref:Uncharacterized protein n=1 Tax=Schizopora paradoxa TaxID=27342 RepID=A0A0H2RLC0_9AGAM|nr:hypothetical protein SCHPADRAFT_528732 [Schizopora paradoxa]